MNHEREARPVTGRPPRAASARQAPIRLAKPDVGSEELEAIRVVLESGTLTNGPETERFERMFADRHQAQHGVAFANGTVALTALYLALDLGPGAEVIVPSLTFISTATSVLHAGAVPVFADVQPDTYNVDPTDVERRITERTCAIVAVHYAGQPADLAELCDLAGRHGLVLIEDAAQAHGATYRGRPVGSLARAAMFSFTPTKNMTTGEGGLITTNDADLAARLRLLRNHGQSGVYEHAVLGFNWRMTEMQAAMGCIQLGKLERILERKARNATMVASRLGDLPGITLPVTRSDRTHVHMLYTLRVSPSRRVRLFEAFRAAEIEARLYFPPAHRQDIFVDHPKARLPITERLGDELISIPFHSLLTDAELEEITRVVISTDCTASRRR